MFVVNETDEFRKLDAFAQGYVSAIFWIWHEEDDQRGESGDTLTAEDFDCDAFARIESDCAEFRKLAGDRITGREREAGIDFFLTRNGHGSGFWDGDWQEHGDVLTAMSREFPEVYFYRGDNGKIFQI